MANAPRPNRTRVPSLGGDGRVEVRYLGSARDGWRDAYHYLLTMPLWAFFAVMGASYFLVNALFALLYMWVGGVQGVRPHDFADAFFFSVETISTVGYGLMAPQSFGAHLVVTAECFVGLFNLAIATGLLFARISRPTARVLFSDRAVITKYEGEPTLILRAANMRRNRVVEAEVTINLLHEVTTAEGGTLRRFETLVPIRSRTPVFFLTWQIMHRIDELSPLVGQSAETLAAEKAEVVVVIRGLDETFAQTIHARASYPPDRIVWGGQLANIFERDDEDRLVIDYTHFHDII